MPIVQGKVLQILSNKLPVIKWYSTYNTQKLINDMIAGITVSLTVMPQALAYAVLAGLEPQVTKTNPAFRKSSTKDVSSTDYTQHSSAASSTLSLAPAKTSR